MSYYYAALRRRINGGSVYACSMGVGILTDGNKTMRFYAGIGARQTPKFVLDRMCKLATFLNSRGFRLRSGGAAGADTAFESGAKGNAVIYTARDDIPNWAFKTVDAHHPAPERLSPYVRRLHARNAMILLGDDGNTPAEFVACWTPGGNVVGGTGQALRVAAEHNIQIFNLATQGHDNDTDLSFNEIADYIEQHILPKCTRESEL